MTKKKITVQDLAGMPSWEWPEEAGRVLLEHLRAKEGSEAQLLEVVGLAGDLVVINDDIVDALLAVVQSSDKSEEVRARAAVALGPVLEQVHVNGFEDPEEVTISEGAFQKINKAFRDLYQDNSAPLLVRRRVLEASVRAPQKWHEEAVRTAYASKEQDWRLTAVFCMGYVRGFDKLIVQALKDKQASIRYEAVRAAGEFSVQAAWPFVSQLLTSADTDKDLLLVAIEAAASINPGDARGLLAAVDDRGDDDIRDALEEAQSLADAFLEGGDEDFGDDEEDDEEDDTVH